MCSGLAPVWAPSHSLPAPPPAPGACWRPSAFLGLWLHHYSPTPLSHGLLSYVYLCPLFLRAPVTGFGAHANPVGPPLNRVHLQRPYFQTRAHSEVPVDMDLGEAFQHAAPVSGGRGRGPRAGTETEAEVLGGAGKRDCTLFSVPT